jgi:hypothetical protein
MFKIKNIVTKLSFYKVVVARSFRILFRKRKEIELLFLKYDTNILFENSFVFINYRFKNAIYYKFKNQKTLEKEIKIFNLKNVENDLKLTVYGFFRKKTFNIVLIPNTSLDTSSFKTDFSKLKIELVETKPIKIIYPEKYPKINKLKINVSKVKIENKKIIIKNNSFNQNEFI